MNYRNVVSEARRLLKRSDQDQWMLAQLTSEVLAEGHTQREWAADLGVSQRHVGILKNVWDRYSEDRDRHPDRTFGEWYAMATLAREKATAAAQVAQTTGVNIKSLVHGAGRSERVEAARELLADPAVAKSVAKYAASDAQVRQAVYERDKDHAERLAEPRRQHQANQRGTDLDFSRIIVSMINVQHTLNRNLDLLRYHDLDSEQREEILEMVERIETSLSWMQSFAESGSRSFDDELNALLGGEDPSHGSASV